MEASKKNITEIFNRASKLQVPYFQRSYVWGETQWSRFLDDMRFATNSNSHYFMGAVILKQQDAQIGETATFTVIDGQQRLTTFMLFFKALYEVNENYEMFTNVFTTFQGGLIMEHNHFDQPVFEKILTDEIDSLSDEEKLGTIYRCYKYFTEELKRDEIDPNRLFSNIMFVGISLQHGEDEQQIFDTINSLGVRLTTAELLKNYLFNRNFESYEQYWRATFENDQETRDYWDTEITAGRIVRSNIDLFLQAYLAIKIQDPSLNVSSEEKERFYKVESIFSSYKEFIDQHFQDKNALIADLKAHASLYRQVINPSATTQYIEAGDRIGRLNIIMFGLEMTTIIPYVLFITKHQTNAAERDSIFIHLEAYLMRRMVTRSSTKNYNNLFRSLIGNQVKTLHEIKEFLESKDDVTNRIPTDDKIIEAFKTEALTNKQAKGILFLIESAIRSSRHSTRLLDFDSYSLEHVMPKKWRNNWNEELLSEQQSRDRDELLLTLGNLTLITSALNSAIRDANWDKKRNGSEATPGLSTFAQSIETFSPYLQKNKWDEDVINERSAELTNQALTVWTL